MCNHENRERTMTVVARDHEGTATIWCDPCIAPVIRALNNGGIETIASCCGHGENDGWVLRADNMLMLLRQVPEGMTPAEFMTAQEGERGYIVPRYDVVRAEVIPPTAAVLTVREGNRDWPACRTYPKLGCVCRGAGSENCGAPCLRKQTGDLAPIPLAAREPQ